MNMDLVMITKKDSSYYGRYGLVLGKEVNPDYFRIEFSHGMIPEIGIFAVGEFKCISRNIEVEYAMEEILEWNNLGMVIITGDKEWTGSYGKLISVREQAGIYNIEVKSGFSMLKPKILRLKKDQFTPVYPSNFYQAFGESIDFVVITKEGENCGRYGRVVGVYNEKSCYNGPHRYRVRINVRVGDIKGGEPVILKRTEFQIVEPKPLNFGIPHGKQEVESLDSETYCGFTDVPDWNLYAAQLKLKTLDSGVERDVFSLVAGEGKDVAAEYVMNSDEFIGESVEHIRIAKVEIPGFNMTLTPIKKNVIIYK